MEKMLQIQSLRLTFQNDMSTKEGMFIFFDHFVSGKGTQGFEGKSNLSANPLRLRQWVWCKIHLSWETKSFWSQFRTQSTAGETPHAGALVLGDQRAPGWQQIGVISVCLPRKGRAQSRLQSPYNHLVTLECLQPPCHHLLDWPITLCLSC